MDRWWIWLPLLTIIVGVAWWSLPIGVLLAIVTIAVVALDPRIDLPFRSSR